MPTPVETVVAFETVDRLFQVCPDQPDLRLGFLMSQGIGKREKNRSAGRTVIRANKSTFEESIVMTCEDKDGLLGISGNVELANDVVYGDWAAGRGGHEIVAFNLCTVRSQDLTNKVLCFPMAW